MDFCVLICILQFYWIYSNSFLMASLGFSVYNISSVNSDSFTTSFAIWMLFHSFLTPSLPPSLSFPFSLFFPAPPPGDVISRGSGFFNISWMSNRSHLEVHFWKISQCCLEDCVGRMSCNPWMLSVQAACHIICSPCCRAV